MTVNRTLPPLKPYWNRYAITFAATMRHTMKIRYAHVDSPVGALLVAVSDDGVCEVAFADGPQARRQPEQEWIHDPSAVQQVAEQLGQYFTGERRQFELPLAAWGTEFQQAVWKALTDIPFGETRSYADVANAIGRPKAVRAVGAANGRNPISIIVPCHRVIGSNGALTGFGGGLPVKQYLLNLERGAPGLFP